MVRFSNDESGHALVELAVVASVLLIIALWSVEISRVLRHQQVATALSRELASVVYRECAADNDAFPSPRTAAASSRFDPRTCIPGVLQREFMPRANRIAPGAKVCVSYYGFDAGVVTRDSIEGDSSITRFSEAQVSSEVLGVRTDLGNALATLGIVVIGEVEVPYKGLGFGADHFVHYVVDKLYGVTIL